MQVFTMGFTQKTAEQFFEKIKKNDIELLIDVRLNNQSQLAGFTKERDLAYFLRVICGCMYAHEPAFAPTKEILDAYKKGVIDWAEYERRFNALLDGRNVAGIFKAKYGKYERVLLLCSEATPEHCHRRLLAERIARELDIAIVHL